jgi:excinuclease ABC subunit A
VIDLGPEGGEGGGEIVAAGTPEEVAQSKVSHTGEHLRLLLGISSRIKGAEVDVSRQIAV